MAQAPEFFVPETTQENQETIFSKLAQWANKAIPSISERVYSIHYAHNGESWVATVGEALSGERVNRIKSKGSFVEQSRPLSDPAIVLAIFPGDSYVVVTNHRLPASVGSKWENPFLAGKPVSVTRFSKAQSG